MKYPTSDELAADDRAARRLYGSFQPDANGCWVWIRARTTAGYGHFHFRNAYYQAHRVMFSIARGPVPDGMQLDHLCRNRACVNPWHLDIVTARQNVERGNSARLTRERADAIRAAVASGISQRKVAPMFGVDHSTVSRICAGLRWGETRQEVAA